jgi:hypothetical protein
MGLQVTHIRFAISESKLLLTKVPKYLVQENRCCYLKNIVAMRNTTRFSQKVKSKGCKKLNGD